MDRPARNPDRDTLLLTGDEIARLMRPADYREAVAAAFRASAGGQGKAPGPMHIAGDGGGFHVKGAGFPAGAVGRTGRAYVAFKVNGNFPGNPQKHGHPTIQGVIVLCDGGDGRVLALMDSIEVTLQRTAAATAVAAQRLARADSSRIAMLGCGAQAWPQLVALAGVLPLAEGFAWDRDPVRAEALAKRAAQLGVSMCVTGELAEATRGADIIVTCTTAGEPFLQPEHVAPGAFVAAVGADAPHKSELAPGLLRGAVLVVDSLAQALAMGDTRHAVEAGAIAVHDVYAELGDVVAGHKPGRTRDDEITVFDSTGVAIQDVASSACAYERACEAAIGQRITLAPAEAGA